MPFAVVTRTSTGDVVVQGNQGEVGFFQMCGGGDPATATLRTGGSGGSVIVKLGTAAGVSRKAHFGPDTVHFSDGLHLTVTGTTPTVCTGSKDHRLSV